VIKAARRVDLTVNYRSYGDGIADEVEDGTIILTVQHFDDLATSEVAAIERLPAGCRIERSAIENGESAAIESSGFDHGSGEPKERAVVVVKALSHVGVSCARAKARASVRRTTIVGRSFSAWANQRTIGSSTPASANPFALSTQLSHRPHGPPSASGS
jgi:hypothetical protein